MFRIIDDEVMTCPMLHQASSTSRRVALLVEASRAYARGLVRGVAQYNAEHEQWSVYFVPRALNDPLPAWLADWDGDGILVRIYNRRMAETVVRTGLPAIDLCRMFDDLGLPTVGPDDHAVVRLALEHLRERGFHNFGCFGFSPGMSPVMDDRKNYFCRLAEKLGLTCHTFSLPRRLRQSWEDDLDRVIEWVRKLPKPAGVMACNDDSALQFLDACHRAGVRTPDEVAVVGIGNDDCLCNLSLPPLSSVDLNPQRIGYEAAALLDRMMAGESVPAQHMTVEPSGVHTRLSTDVLATDDKAVVCAVQFIREHANERIQVADVLKYTNIARGALEPRVRQVLGRTIYQEIQRVRIERVKTLLRDTSMPLKQIASLTGFNYPAYMMRLFRKTVGQTPSQYRSNAR